MHTILFCKASKYNDFKYLQSRSFCYKTDCSIYFCINDEHSHSVPSTVSSGFNTLFCSGTTILRPNHWIRHCQLGSYFGWWTNVLKTKRGPTLELRTQKKEVHPCFAVCLICCFALFGILAGCPHRYFCWQIVFIKSFCNKISVEVVIQLLGWVYTKRIKDLF